jgi:hypothetical protein
LEETVKELVWMIVIENDEEVDGVEYALLCDRCFREEVVLVDGVETLRDGIVRHRQLQVGHCLLCGLDTQPVEEPIELHEICISV